jgi:hypothetical protein
MDHVALDVHPVPRFSHSEPLHGFRVCAAFSSWPPVRGTGVDRLCQSDRLDGSPNTANRSGLTKPCRRAMRSPYRLKTRLRGAWRGRCRLRRAHSPPVSSSLGCRLCRFRCHVAFLAVGPACASTSRRRLQGRTCAAR